jgi:hypothetical protein
MVGCDANACQSLADHLVLLIADLADLFRPSHRCVKLEFIQLKNIFSIKIIENLSFSFFTRKNDEHKHPFWKIICLEWQNYYRSRLCLFYLHLFQGVRLTIQHIIVIIICFQEWVRQKQMRNCDLIFYLLAAKQEKRSNLRRTKSGIFFSMRKNDKCNFVSLHCEKIIGLVEQDIFQIDFFPRKCRKCRNILFLILTFTFSLFSLKSTFFALRWNSS